MWCWCLRSIDGSLTQRRVYKGLKKWHFPHEVELVRKVIKYKKGYSDAVLVDSNAIVLTDQGPFVKEEGEWTFELEITPYYFEGYRLGPEGLCKGLSEFTHWEKMTQVSESVPHFAEIYISR